MSVPSSVSRIAICVLPWRIEDLLLCIFRVLPRYFSGARFPNGLSIASDLLSDSVKRALLSVKGSHKSETVRQKQTPHAVNQAFCQLAQGARLPATFLTPRILVFVIGVSRTSAKPTRYRRTGKLETPRAAMYLAVCPIKIYDLSAEKVCVVI